MSEAVDNLDPAGYALTTANVESGLEQLGFQFHGMNTSHPEDPRAIYHKNLGRGVRAVVVTSAATPTRLNFFKIRFKGRGVFADREELERKENISVNDLRRIVMRWHTEALDVLHLLLDADVDALDPRAELERVPRRCPACGSTNIDKSKFDTEGLLDCFNCGIWFDEFEATARRPTGNELRQIWHEALDPDDPEAFLQSLPQHPEAAGMKQPQQHANYWQYLFESREGYRCRLALSHSMPGHTGSYTVSLDVGGYHSSQFHRVATLFWQSQEEFLRAEMQLRESVQRFIQAIKDRKERKNRPDYAKLEQLWEKLFAPLNQGPRPAQESLDEIRDLKAYAMKHGEPRRITTTFSRTTPESAAEGDFSETGWIDQEGVDMNPDDFDREEGVTVADKAAAYLFNEGAYTTSSSQFHPGMWYSTEWSTTNYQTGEEEERNFHLVGFSEEEERAVWDKFNDLRKRSRQIR